MSFFIRNKKVSFFTHFHYSLQLFKLLFRFMLKFDFNYHYCFFLISFCLQKNDKKRKKQISLDQKIKSKKRKEYDEEIESDSEDEIVYQDDAVEDDQELAETAQEKKIRLAKKYLQEIENEEKQKLNVDVVGSGIISTKLKEDILEKSGKLLKKVADKYAGIDGQKVIQLKNGHKKPITCLVVSSDNRFIFSSSKDGSIVKWCFITNRKLKVIKGLRKTSKEDEKGHKTVINSLAISTDSKFLASCCNESLINIWDPSDLSLIHTFRGHRSSVNGLVFRKSSHTLYSCSNDRTVKVWNLDEMCYVETLFGHQEPITGIDCGLRERPVTCGGSDHTVRLWKIIEESQLVFQGNEASIDCIKYLDEQYFLTGSDDGLVRSNNYLLVKLISVLNNRSLSIWGVFKKKPIVTKTCVHGSEHFNTNWISSIATFVNTDLFATGSYLNLLM